MSPSFESGPDRKSELRRVLYATGGDPEEERGFVRAVELADRAGADLTVVMALGEEMPAQDILAIGRTDLTRLIVRHHEEQLESVVERYRGRVPSIGVQVAIGRPEVEIARTVVRGEHDLLFKTKGAPGEDAGPTAVDLKLSRGCPGPIWFDSPGQSDDIDRVLVPVDVVADDAEAQQLTRNVLELGLFLAELYEAELHVLHAWTAYGELSLRHGLTRIDHDEVDEYVESIRSERSERLSRLLESVRSDVVSRTHLIKGSADEVIAHFALGKEADLVVMGTVARSGIRGRLIGNTAESVLTDLDVSVLLVKPEEFASPWDLDR